ncbi:MAG: transposase [Gaiellaceae bacterium]
MRAAVAVRRLLAEDCGEVVAQHLHSCDELPKGLGATLQGLGLPLQLREPSSQVRGGHANPEKRGPTKLRPLCRLVARQSVAADLAEVLDSPEVAALVEELDALHWTGRRGFGARALVGACLVKSLYALPTWTRTARLIHEHAALTDILGNCPSHWSMYRFSRKLREHKPLMDACLARVSAALRAEHPEMGRDVAIDGSNMPAYSSGMREHPSDSDASWGHRSAVSHRKAGSYLGFKLHAAVCARTGLPLAWQVEPARVHDSQLVEPLLDSLLYRGFAPVTVAADKAYDSERIHAACEARNARPIIPIRALGKLGENQRGVPPCEHGDWVFAGADFKRRAAKYRCPTGECSPKSVWIKPDRRHPLIPRESKRWRELYNGRSAVEREFATLKCRFGLSALSVRGLERVRLHTDLTMLARLSLALARARTVALAA